MKVANNILDLIGKTPLVQIQKMKFDNGAIILLKLESLNPGGSVKDRVACAMIIDAEKHGLITRKTTIVESTSGNTGVGLAMVCAVKGYKLILTMPESMSIERRNLVKAYGAEVVLTEAAKGMKGAIEKTEEIKSKIGNAFIPMQFENLSNPQIHRIATAKEIWQDTEGKVDVFVSGIGTGGTITGVSEDLKMNNKNIKCYAIEPENSPVLSGGKSSLHKIQGIGAGFVPSILNTEIYDDVIKVSNENAFEKAKYLAQNEGILCGISSGAIFHAAVEIAIKPENSNKIIVAMVCDTGERYLSTELFS